MNEREYLKQLGANIRAVRKSKRVTIIKLSETMHMHTTTLGYIERGKKDAHILTLVKIAEALNVDVKTFI